MEDYLKLLPSEFTNFKRSIIKKSILFSIERLFEKLNNTPIFNGRFFSKEDVVNFVLNHRSKEKFDYIPHLTGMKFYTDDYWSTEKNIIDDYKSFLIQNWMLYEERIKVKNKTLVDKFDIDSDGFPSTSRGSLCCNFIPVKNGINSEINDEIELFNPRNNKIEIFTILKINEEDNSYRCINSKNEIKYLIDHQNVKDAYSALFPINKEIYSGWWNKILINNKKYES